MICICVHYLVSRYSETTIPACDKKKTKGEKSAQVVQFVQTTSEARTNNSYSRHKQPIEGQNEEMLMSAYNERSAVYGRVELDGGTVPCSEKSPCLSFAITVFCFFSPQLSSGSKTGLPSQPKRRRCLRLHAPFALSPARARSCQDAKGGTQQTQTEVTVCFHCRMSC